MAHVTEEQLGLLTISPLDLPMPCSALQKAVRVFHASVREALGQCGGYMTYQIDSTCLAVFTDTSHAIM